MKLNAFISHSGFCSRRKAAGLIKAGDVKLNGTTVLEPWREVTSNDKVTVKNRPLKTEKLSYVIFNKPKGVTTTVEDRFAEKKIVDLVPKDLGRLYPVGRLDKDSRGLIILTNDGDLCHKLTHPKFETEKEYIVFVKGALSEDIIAGLKNGIRDGEDFLKVKSLSIEKSGKNSARFKAVVCEGKKRHLRRLFEHFDLAVKDLKRIRIGSLELGDLKGGHFRIVDRNTIYEALGDKVRSFH